VTSALSTLAARASALPKRSALRLGWAGLLLPGLIFLAVFFGWPLVKIVSLSVSDPSLSHNYSILTQSDLYVQSYITTFKIAGIVTAVCLLIGYPYAYVMHKGGTKIAILLGVLVLVPFWSSLLVRTWAWTIWLQDTGIINEGLQSLGLIGEPLPLIRTTFSVVVGMTYVMLPFMVLSLYAGMRNIDPSLVRAARSLGASPATAFRKVFLPLSRAGVYTGCLLVFVLSLGFYITPALLGSPDTTMISEVIADQVQRRGEFGRGSALALVLLVLTLVLIALGARIASVNSDRVLKE
jgi:putative spermidine/putrescine transport system permease protein